jgi:hypothetical protein
MESKDPAKKLQFWTRESQYKRLLNVCPNKGDLSELMREGLEIGLSIREQRLAAFRKIEPEQKAS